MYWLADPPAFVGDRPVHAFQPEGVGEPAPRAGGQGADGEPEEHIGRVRKRVRFADVGARFLTYTPASCLSGGVRWQSSDA